MIYYFQQYYLSVFHIAYPAPMIGTTLYLAAGVAATAIAVTLLYTRRTEAAPLPEDTLQEPVGSKASFNIRPSKDRSIYCQICMGRIKVGQGYTVCKCKMEFHRPCVERTGYCPYCDQEYTRKGFRRRYNLPDDAPVTLRRCPVCADFLPKEANVCDCGAVFLETDGSFTCPNCGSRVGEDYLNCPHCSERFKEYDAVHCNYCKALVPEGENVCECGTVLDDKCPDCGWRLGRDEDRCPICGLMFELIR